MDKLKDLQERLKAALQRASDIAKQAEDADRDFTDEERTEVYAKMEEAKDLKKQIDQAKDDDAARQTIAELGKDIGVVDGPQKKTSPSGLIVPQPGQSLGSLVVNSPEYKDLMASAPNGVFSKDMRVQSRPIGFKNLITGSSDTSAGAFVDDDRQGLLVGLDSQTRPLTLRDVVTPGTTSSDTVEFVRLSSITNNAAPVAESDQVETPGDPGPSTGVKPQSTLAAVKVTTPVRTIAHWSPLTKRALSDAAQIRTIVDGFLRYGLEEELEDQMISGDGTGENLEGLSQVSGVQDQTFDTDILATTRKAKTKVRLVGRSMANAYVFNPLDLEEIDLLQDNEARYYFGGPAAPGTAQTLWGLPVIESEAVPQGTGYVGDWRKAILWDREQAAITVSDSHNDFFVRNMVAVLAEMRAAFGVIQPNAFVAIDMEGS